MVCGVLRCCYIHVGPRDRASTPVVWNGVEIVEQSRRRRNRIVHLYSTRYINDSV
jgi:hypothetical protein